MRQLKKLTALLLAGAAALAIFTGCSSSGKATVNGKNIVTDYLAFYEKWQVGGRGPGEYDEKMDQIATRALDIVAEAVNSNNTTWENVLDGGYGYLANDTDGFTEEGAGLKKAIFGDPAPENYKIILALAEIPDESKKSPALIAYELYQPLELGWVHYTTYKGYNADPHPETKYKMGAALKTVDGKNYALLVGRVIC